MGFLTSVANFSRRAIVFTLRAMLYPPIRAVAVASPFLAGLFQRLMTGEAEEAARQEE